MCLSTEIKSVGKAELDPVRLLMPLTRQPPELFMVSSREVLHLTTREAGLEMAVYF